MKENRKGVRWFYDQETGRLGFFEVNRKQIGGGGGGGGAGGGGAMVVTKKA